MAKQISQETFDAVVKENVEEFEMEHEEAIQDAVSQFEAQGINLANIVKDLCLQNSGTGEVPSQHPVIEATQSLEKCIESEDSEEDSVKSHLSKMQEECDIDLAHRCLAGKNNAYPVLVKALEKYRSNPDVLESVVSAFCSLCNGQPDLLDMQGTVLLRDLLKEQSSHPENAAALVKLIRLTCIMHETNRQTYVGEDIIPVLMGSLELYRENANLVKEVCFALRVLTFDDDPRVPFGKAHDHAKMIVTEADALRKIMNVCQDYSTNSAVLGELFLTLSRLAVRNEFCQEIMDLGGLPLMLGALEKNMDNQGIVTQALKVLKAIAGNDQVKIAIAKANGIELMLSAMAKHQRQPVVCEAGCATLATLALRNPDHCQRIVSGGGAEVIVKAMQLHPTVAGLQKQGCMAIRNTVARTRQHCPPFLEQGAENYIQRALTNHTECHDEAKAALRDLDCKVELQERWKGEGKGIKA